MTEIGNGSSCEPHHPHAFARFLHPTTDHQKPSRCGLEDDTRDHRGKRRDRSNIRDRYFLSPSKCNILYLNEDSLDDFAHRYGYSKLYFYSPSSPLASYRKGPCHLNFWLKTGTVGSYLDHPKRGKTQLFRADVDPCEAEAIFRNPRVRRSSSFNSDSFNSESFNSDSFRSERAE